MTWWKERFDLMPAIVTQTGIGAVALESLIGLNSDIFLSSDPLKIGASKAGPIIFFKIPLALY